MLEAAGSKMCSKMIQICITVMNFMEVVITVEDFDTHDNISEL